MPDRIYVLTTSKGRVSEMKRELPRIVETFGFQTPIEKLNRVYVNDLDSFAALWINRYVTEALGIPKNFRFWREQEAHITLVRESMNDISQTGVSTDELYDIVWWYQFLRSGAAQDENPPVPREWRDVLEIYRQLRNRLGAIDVADLIPMAVEAVREDPGIAQALHKPRPAHLIVDDFQNITPIAYRFLRMISRPVDSITIAGDPNSCIGAWRGADAALLEQFREDHPKATHVQCPFNYRSGKLHGAFAAALAREDSMDPFLDEEGRVAYTSMQQDDEKPRLVEVDGNLESMYANLARELGSLHQLGLSYQDMAVLCRRHATIDGLRPHLDGTRIPYQEKGILRVVTNEGDPNGITLSTIHAAQGSQWPRVWVLDASDDIFPGPIENGELRANREEQRIFFVAATRAARQLEIWVGSENGRSQPTRFLRPVENLLERITISSNAHSTES